VSSTGPSSGHSERRRHGGCAGISRPAFRSSLFRRVSCRVASLEFSDTLFGHPLWLLALAGRGLGLLCCRHRPRQKESELEPREKSRQCGIPPESTLADADPERAGRRSLGTWRSAPGLSPWRARRHASGPRDFSPEPRPPLKPLSLQPEAQPDASGGCSSHDDHQHDTGRRAACRRTATADDHTRGGRTAWTQAGPRHGHRSGP